jgi:hypothetical protein
LRDALAAAITQLWGAKPQCGMLGASSPVFEFG